MFIFHELLFEMTHWFMWAHETHRETSQKQIKGVEIDEGSQ